jgi:hypothetical protein
VIRHIHEVMTDATERADAQAILALPSLAGVGRMREWPPDDAEERARALIAAVDKEVAAL